MNAPVSPGLSRAESLSATPRGTAPERESIHKGRVSIAAPAEWVHLRQADLNYRAKASSALTLLLMDHQYHVATGELYECIVQRLETLQAVQQLSQWKLNFDPATQHLTIHHLRIWRDGQSVEQAAMDRFHFLQREENLDRLSLDGSVTLVALLHDVRPGDAVEASYTLRTQPRLFREKFSIFHAVPAHVPVGEFHLNVRFPADRPMQWNGSRRGFEPQALVSGEDLDWSWSLSQVEPQPEEPAVPSWVLPIRWVQMSDFASWAEVAAGLETVWFAPSPGEEVRKLAAEIASAEGHLAEHVERVITMVQDEIRYLSVNIEMGGQIPARAEVVLERRYGDCKDKCLLLTHLLRALGVEARPVLVHTALLQSVESLLPTPIAFNHCIVEYVLEGQRRWVDCTIPCQGGTAFTRQVPPYVAGLVLDPAATGLSRTPPEQPLVDSYILHEIYYPDTAGGKSVLKTSLIVRGMCADQIRRRMAEEGEDSVARRNEQLCQQRHAGVVRIGSLAWQDDRTANELTIAEKFEISGLVRPCATPGEMLMECSAHLILGLLALPPMQTRSAPLDFPIPHDVEHWIEVECANKLSPDLPKTTVASEAFRFWREVRRSAIVHTLKRLKSEIPAHRLAIHMGELEKVWAHSGVIYGVPAGVSLPRSAHTPVRLSAPRPTGPEGVPGAKPKWQRPRHAATEVAPTETVRTVRSAHLGSHPRKERFQVAPPRPAIADLPPPPPSADHASKIQVPARKKTSSHKGWQIEHLVTLCVIALGALVVLGAIVYLLLIAK